MNLFQPWDTTEVWVGDLNDKGTAIVEESSHKVAGGDNISVLMPRWTPDNQLLYIGDQSEWWNIYHITPGTIRILTLIYIHFNFKNTGIKQLDCFKLDCFDQILFK